MQKQLSIRRNIQEAFPATSAGEADVPGGPGSYGQRPPRTQTINQHLQEKIMSHGKTVMLKGSTKKPVDMPGNKKKDFYAEAEVGIAFTHGKVTGDATKAQKEIVDDINLQIDKMWKKEKGTGESPEITATDLDFETFSKR